MRALEGYDDVLADDGPEDRWADHLLDVAVGHLDAFADGDWRGIADRLATRGARWRTRCAETLSEVGPARAVPLLLDLLGDPEDAVVAAAVDSLASLAQDGATVTLEPRRHAVVQRLADDAGLAALAARRLLAAI